MLSSAQPEPTLGDNKENTTKMKKNPRLKLPLNQTCDAGCSEFSYVSLVKESRKNLKRQTNGTAISNEDDRSKSDAESLAKYYEEKYGSGGDNGNLKKRRDRARDLANMGYGYDETDPFVDNSECYDEVVPKSLTTQLGGFYINTGRLEFKHISEESSTDDEDDALPLSAHLKKRKMLLSEESDNDFKDSRFLLKKKKTLKNGNSKNVSGKRHRKLSLQNKEKLGKLGKSVKKKQTKVQLLVAKAKAQHHLSSSGSDKSEKKAKHHPNLNSSDVRSKDSNRDMLDDLYIQHIDSSPMGHNISILSDDAMDDLPLSIPTTVKEKISSLTKIAKTNEKEGKMKFFSPDINKLLLGIESASQSLTNRERSDIYQHLTPHVPCSKDTLIKRMKKLHSSKQDESLKQPIERLKKAVDDVMTNQIEEYNVECAAQQMAKLEEKSVIAPSTDEEDDPNQTPSHGEEKTKRTYAPRRKFKWNDNIRNLLLDVAKKKLEQFESKRTNQTVEEYLKNFFDNEVKNLWPKGWMQARALLKESRENLHYSSSSLNKQKKVAVFNGGKKSLSVGKVEKRPNFSASVLPFSASTSKLDVPSSFVTASAEIFTKPTVASSGASKQLFKDSRSDSSLSVSMNLNCNADEVLGQTHKDLMHKAIASAQKEVATKKHMPAKPAAPVRKDFAKSVKCDPQAFKPHQQIHNNTVKVWHEAGQKSALESGRTTQGTSKNTRDSLKVDSKFRDDNLTSHTTTQIKTSAKKSKPQVSKPQSVSDSALTPDFLKYAAMMAAPSGQPLDNQVLSVLSSMSFPAFLPGNPPNPIPSPGVDDMSNFLKMHQMAIQSQLGTSVVAAAASPQSSYKPHSISSGPKKTTQQVTSSSQFKPSSTQHSFPTSAKRHNRHSVIDSTDGNQKASKRTSPNEHYKPAHNGTPARSQAKHFLGKQTSDSKQAMTTSTTLSKSLDAGKQSHKGFVTPKSLTRYQPYLSQSSPTDYHKKSSTASLAATCYGTPGGSYSNQLSPGLGKLPYASPVYPFPKVQGFASGVSSTSMIKTSPTTSLTKPKQTTSQVGGYIPSDTFLQFNQLPSHQTKKIPENLDRDKAAMDALLSAHLHGARR